MTLSTKENAMMRSCRKVIKNCARLVVIPSLLATASVVCSLGIASGCRLSWTRYSVSPAKCTVHGPGLVKSCVRVRSPSKKVHSAFGVSDGRYGSSLVREGTCRLLANTPSRTDWRSSGTTVLMSSGANHRQEDESKTMRIGDMKKESIESCRFDSEPVGLSLSRKSQEKLLGLVDAELWQSIRANVVSWFFATYMPRKQLRNLLPKKCHEEEEEEEDDEEEDRKQKSATEETKKDDRTRCVSIGRPGGMEQLRVVRLRDAVATMGYNIEDPDFRNPPYTLPLKCLQSSGTRDNVQGAVDLPMDCVVVKNEAFSVNFADCAIRWGLYDSAKQYVGWPIVPGFDVAGIVEHTGKETFGGTSPKEPGALRAGDRVYGCTLFGSYSSRLVVPQIQLRKIPPHLSFAEAASIPTAALTALHALDLAGHFPAGTTRFRNRAILIHSAAGGVGSMIAQMSKLLGLGPIVGVVGSSSKAEAAKTLGCDVVIDKSSSPDLWEQVLRASPSGYSAVMDPNGPSTLQQSFDHLAVGGRLIVYGFHTNLPMGTKTALHPRQWLQMARKKKDLPKFDPMSMRNRAIFSFNLSFFASEGHVVTALLDTIDQWLWEGKLHCPPIAEFDELSDIAEAHTQLQSGQSVGKIVIKTG